MTGRVHSLQSLGTVDGPGLRYVVFMQGCPLKCGCCHNPDTQSLCGGTEYEHTEIVEKACSLRSFYGETGGITLSGGEPLIQPIFGYELFSLAHRKGLNTCLDTSGCILNDDIKKFISETDRVLLDIKYTEDTLYKKYVGCSISKVLEFLGYLDCQNIPVTLRQVIIPTLNDSKDNISRLKAIKDRYGCIDGIELLPFKKLCEIKYRNMGIPFPFAHIPEPTEESIKELEAMLRECKNSPERKKQGKPRDFNFKNYL